MVIVYGAVGTGLLPLLEVCSRRWTVRRVRGHIGEDSKVEKRTFFSVEEWRGRLPRSHRRSVLELTRIQPENWLAENEENAENERNEGNGGKSEKN